MSHHKVKESERKAIVADMLDHFNIVGKKLCFYNYQVASNKAIFLRLPVDF